MLKELGGCLTRELTVLTGLHNLLFPEDLQTLFFSPQENALNPGKDLTAILF